jgi:hypothetical protein
MLVLIVLFGGLLVFRLLGLSGVSIFSTWRAAMTCALALMFLFTASGTFRQNAGRSRTNGPAMGAEPASGCFDNRVPRGPWRDWLIIPETPGIAKSTAAGGNPALAVLTELIAESLFSNALFHKENLEMYVGKGLI